MNFHSPSTETMVAKIINNLHIFLPNGQFSNAQRNVT